MDRSEFEVEIAQCYHVVYKVVKRILKDEHDAEDVTQNACMKAWMYLDKFRGVSAFSTWLTRIAINESYNCMEKQRRVPPMDTLGEDTVLDTPSFADWADPESLHIADESRDAADEAMGIMPDEHAVAFTLRNQVGLTYDQIADILDVPVGTIRSRIHRAKKYIRENMEH